MSKIFQREETLGSGTPGEPAATSARASVSVICVYNKPDILREFLIAGLDRQTVPHERLLIDNRDRRFSSCAAALNDGASRAAGDIFVFAHQDVELLEADALERIRTWVTTLPALGIAGVVGAADVAGDATMRHVHSVLLGTRSRNVATPGRPIDEPTAAQTLDELLLVIPREAFQRRNFDAETCDAWDFYGVDYALSVQRDGLRAYVLPLQVLHGSPGHVGDDYYRVLRKLRRKHRGLPAISATINRWPWWYPLTAYLLARRLRRLLR